MADLAIQHEPLDSKHRCSGCVRLGIWDEWVLKDGCCQRLEILEDRNRPNASGPRLQIMMLSPLKEFQTMVSPPSSYAPILAGINDLGDREYVRYFQCCENGRRVLVKQPEEIISDEYSRCHFCSERSRCCSFGVLVSLDDPHEEASKAAVASFGGVDASGSLFWKDYCCRRADGEWVRREKDGSAESYDPLEQRDGWGWGEDFELE